MVFNFRSCFKCEYLNSPPDSERCRSCLNHSNFREKERRKEHEGWCNTCEYRVSEERCQGCAIRDKFGNLIDLSNYKEEKKMGDDGGMPINEIGNMTSRFDELTGMPVSKKDNINPDHYKNQTSLECIEAMEIIFGEAAVLDFCLCNSWKYIWRYKNKNGEEDLVKAGWYLAYAYDYIASNDNRFNLLKRMIHYVTEHGVEVKYNGQST